MSISIVTSGSASSITQTTATLQASVAVITGSSPGSYVFYWGTTDGGTTPASWDHSQSIGAHADGTITLAITGLTDELPYYYTVAGTNDAGTDWGQFNNTGSPNSAPFSTLAYPQKFPGQCLTQLGSRVQSASILGRWADGLCPASVLDHFRGGIIPVYGAEQARVQITAHTTTVAHYTVPVATWTTSAPVSRTYSPSPNPGQIVGATGIGVGMVPPSFDLSAPSDGDAWMMKKGAWKLVVSTNVNASFYNTDPNISGVQGGPYPLVIKVYPYSIHGRSKRALPPTTYTDSVSNGADTKTHRFVLRSDCFWFISFALTVWANQSNQPGGTVTNVDIATFDIVATRT